MTIAKTGNILFGITNRFITPRTLPFVPSQKGEESNGYKGYNKVTGFISNTEGKIIGGQERRALFASRRHYHLISFI